MRHRKHSRDHEEEEMLERERFGIERQYIELDDAILHGQGSDRILASAKRLVQSLIQHFAHEEQFRRRISFPVLDDPRAVWRMNMTELLQIESGLIQGEVYAALRLRSFCKGWIHKQKIWTSLFQPAPAPESESARL